MTNVKDKPPNEIFLDLIQENEMDYIEHMGKILSHEIRPRTKGDTVPAIYSVLSSATPEQRGIPHGKKVLERVQFTVMYYTDDLRYLWSAYQSIKEIVVGNNKVQDTSQFEDSGIEWSMIDIVDFDYVFIDEETLLGYVAITIEAVYDESYL